MSNVINVMYVGQFVKRSRRYKLLQERMAYTSSY